MSNPFVNIVTFLPDLLGNLVGLNTNNPIVSAVSGFFSDIEGKIATGIETGIIAIFKDLWDVVVGPAEVIVGAILIIMAIFLTFKDDLGQVAQAFGMIPR